MSEPSPVEVEKAAGDFFAAEEERKAPASETTSIPLPPGTVEPATKDRIPIQRDTTFDSSPVRNRDENNAVFVERTTNQKALDAKCIPTYEEKVAYAKSLGIDDDRLVLTIELNSKLQTRTGTPLLIKLRDRLSVEDDIINAATARHKHSHPMEILGMPTMLSMACQLMRYGGKDFTPFTGDPEKSPESQVDTLLQTYRSMFGRMTFIQINACLTALRIFTGKKVNLEDGTVNEDFFVQSHSEDFSESISGRAE
jgi:hypothetical protein